MRRHLLGIIAGLIGGTLVPSLTSAAVCTLDATTRTLTVSVAAESARLSPRTDGRILLNNASCAGATLTSVDQISIAGSSGAEVVTLDLRQHGLELIELQLDLATGRDRFVLLGADQAENEIVIGSLGIDLNGDDQVDVLLAGIDVLTIKGGAMKDAISAAGSIGTAGPFTRSINIHGLASDDVLVGGQGADQIFGGLGEDVLQGGDGNDRLVGGPGNDVEQGEAGNDRFDQGASIDGDDLISGGSGRDTISYALRTNPIEVYLDDVQNDGELWGEIDDVSSDIEVLVGGASDDLLVGSDADNVLKGGAGEDALDGGGGNDILRGGPGGDIIWGGDGNDRLEGGDGPDSLFGEAGADRLLGGDGDDWLEGGAGNDTLTCGEGLDYGLDLDGGIAADCADY